MLAVATTRVDVLRGTSTDEYLDEVDIVDVASGLLNIPMSIIEKTKQVVDPVSGTPRTVRFATGRAEHGTDIRSSDRIRDRSTGQIYAIQSLTTTQSPTHKNDLRLDLVRVD